jgi:hypothetical protein
MIAAIRREVSPKTVTRRMGTGWDDLEAGDRLVVCEEYWQVGRWLPDGDKRTKHGAQKLRFVATDPAVVSFERPNVTQPRDGTQGWVYRHARFMPARLSRMTLEVTEPVTRAPVRDITDDEAIREGACIIDETIIGHEGAVWTMGFRGLHMHHPRTAFHVAWDLLHPGGWATDVPARIAFRRLP